MAPASAAAPAAATTLLPFFSGRGYKYIFLFFFWPLLAHVSGLRELGRKYILAIDLCFYLNPAMVIFVAFYVFFFIIYICIYDFCFPLFLPTCVVALPWVSAWVLGFEWS